MKSIRGSIPAHIVQRVSRLRVLEEALRDCVPAECCAHCRVAGTEGDALLLVADSPAWRSRLHFYSDRIISHFNGLGKSAVQRVRIRVAADSGIDAPRQRRDPPLRMPATTARGFAALAQETEDPALRSALQRLAAHALEE